MKIASVAARVLAVVMITAVVAGCANTTRFHSPPTGGRLELLGGTSDQLPRSEKLRSKTFGQHEFHAVDSNGEELYGILPLSVDGGKIATSILFFAPALFGGFRDVFEFYRIDPVEKVIRYRKKRDEEWRVYVPTQAEMERARDSFARQNR